MVIVGACCLVPLGWMVLALASRPELWRDVSPSSFRAALLVRTLVYNAGAAAIAVGLGLPVGLYLGRSRGMVSRIAWTVVPTAIFLPSLAYAYGWNQLLWLCRAVPVAATGADVLRCIWTLGAWLWAIPACTVGLALRRMDTNVQQQALMDGVLLRITLRQLAGPILAAWAACTILASQEFAVYEPTGISVIATEIRMVFDTGAFSSLVNPATATDISGGGVMSPDQAARSAAAIATAIPLLVITGLLAVGAGLAAVRYSAADAPSEGHWPRALDATKGLTALAWGLIAVTTLTPVVSLVLSARSGFFPRQVLVAFGPAVGGSLGLGMGTCLGALVIAASAATRWPRGALGAAMAAFLVGGQLLAIALIRVFNQPVISALYDGPVLPIAAYTARFGFLPLAAAASLWTRPWQELREMASLDGAGPVRTAANVVWPLAWPTLVAGAVLAGALSLSEVPATVLLTPQHPRVLTNLIQTWVHTVRYDPMIEASLLLITLITLPVLLAVVLHAVARGRFGR